MPRRCESNGPNRGLVVEPGNPWFDKCDTWSYVTGGSYFNHPLLSGRESLDADDVAALLAISPPESGDGGVEVTVVTTQEEFGQMRSISAEIRPEAISEFAFLVDQDLRFDPGPTSTERSMSAEI